MQFCKEIFKYKMCIYGFSETFNLIFEKKKYIKTLQGTKLEMTFIFMQFIYV